jgi:hypothetical protein
MSVHPSATTQVTDGEGLFMLPPPVVVLWCFVYQAKSRSVISSAFEEGTLIMFL